MVKPLTYGRMGNFLFQAAAAAGYAWKHGLEFTLPSTTTDKIHNPIYLEHLVNPRYDPALPRQVLEEKAHSYQELPFREEWRGQNIILDGYWQSEKYFKEWRPQILDAFGFKWVHSPNWVSVHVRRGDYLRLTRKHPPVSVAWYNTAMARFPGCQFLFFSDDIAWCKTSFGGRDDVAFSEGHNEWEDLTIMSHCEHQICSCSTFSWWAMWLNRNPNKRAIFPKLWFVLGHGGLDVKDIVPEWCERL